MSSYNDLFRPNRATSQTEDAFTPGNESKHNILTIPLEMCEAICELAEPEDLLNLRLVNRETKEKINRTFIATHFTERMFLISYQDSLETLLAIAEHPEFGRTMRTVLLCNDMLPDANHPLIQRGRWGRRWELGEVDLITAKIVSELQDREWHRLTTEQREFMERDGDIHMLTMIFSAFRRMGNTPAVKLMDQDEAGVEARGARTMETLSGRKLIWGLDDSRPIDDPLSAFTLADFPVSDLTIGFDNFGWKLYQLVDNPTTEASVKSVFKSLKNLDLSTRSDDDSSIQDAIDTAALFGVCESLECLIINMFVPTFYNDAHSVNNQFVTTLLSQDMPKLKQLELREFAIPFQDLVAFISRHEKLKSMAFAGCCFCLLGKYDDGLNDKQGRHNECMESLLREASGLSDIDIEGSVVCQWRAREPKDDEESEEEGGGIDEEGDDGGESGSDDEE